MCVFGPITGKPVRNRVGSLGACTAGYKSGRTMSLACILPSGQPRAPLSTSLRMGEACEPTRKNFAVFNELGSICRPVAATAQWSVCAPSPSLPCAHIGTRWQAGRPWPTLWKASLRLAVLPPLVRAKRLHPCQAPLPPSSLSVATIPILTPTLAVTMLVIGVTEIRT